MEVDHQATDANPLGIHAADADSHPATPVANDGSVDHRAAIGDSLELETDGAESKCETTYTDVLLHT